MAIPGKQLTYSPSLGIGQTPSYFFKTRDPDSNDSSPEYPIYSMWINTTTKGIWYLESRTSSNGTVSALWRAVAPIVIATVAPTTADYQYPIGQAWINTAANDYYGLVNVTGTTATWNLLAAGGGDLQNLTPDSGGVINPISGTIQVTGYPQTASNIKGMKTFNGGTNVLQLSNLDALTPYVVGSDPNVSAFTTIQSAINAANADGGGTVFILPGTYTEDLTLEPGVTLTTFTGDGYSGNVIILGKATATGAGKFNINNVQLKTNGDFCLVVSGSSATVVNLVNVFINCANNTGISYTTSNASSAIFIYDSIFDMGTTGIGYYSISSSGNTDIYNTILQNSGGSTTASSNSSASVGLFNCTTSGSHSTSSTGNFSAYNSTLNSGAFNATSVTTAGTGTGILSQCYITGGTASAISIGSGTTLGVFNCNINSDNTNAITGAGTLSYSNLIFTGTSSKINTTTQVGGVAQGGTAQAPSAGYIGEQIRGTGSAQVVTSDTPVNVTSISLTAGIWDVDCLATFAPGSGSPSNVYLGSNTTSETLSNLGDQYNQGVGMTTGVNNAALSVPSYRYTLTTTTTIYLVANALFGSGTGPTALGRISATRVG